MADEFAKIKEMLLGSGAFRQVNLGPLGDKILGGHGSVANSAVFSRIGMGIFYTKAAAVSCFMVLRALAQERALNARLIIQGQRTCQNQDPFMPVMFFIFFLANSTEVLLTFQTLAHDFDLSK